MGDASGLVVGASLAGVGSVAIMSDSESEVKTPTAGAGDGGTVWSETQYAEPRTEADGSAKAPHCDLKAVGVPDAPRAAESGPSNPSHVPSVASRASADEPFQRIYWKLCDYASAHGKTAPKMVRDDMALVCCPGHDDHNPSATLKRLPDGKVSFKCHAGCNDKDALAKIEVGIRDLYPPDNRRTAVATKTGAKKSRRKSNPTFEAAVERAVWVLNKKTDDSSWKLIRHWPYRDARGTEVFRTARFENTKGAKDYRPFHQVSDEWFIADPDGPLPLFNLENLAGQIVFVFEGEKCVEIARKRLGVAATTSAHGAKSAKRSDWSPLAGKDVVVVPDNDDAGRKYTSDVAALVSRAGGRVRTLHLPGLEHEGDDLEQWLELNRDRPDEELAAELDRLADEAEPWEGDGPPLEAAEDEEAPEDEGAAGPEKGRSKEKSKSEPKPSQADVLVAMAVERAEFFRTPDDFICARVTVRNHLEVYKVRSKAFRLWLNGLYFQATARSPSSEPLQQALATLEAKARFDGGEEELHHRVAGRVGDLGEELIINLGNRDWEAVRITSDGWEVLEQPPVNFYQPSIMQPIARPLPGGNLDELRSLVNLSSGHDWLLFVATLTSYFRPTGPYPILMVSGEQGSAKSTTTRLSVLLTDPTAIPLRCEPKSVHDLMVATRGAWVLAFDNLSGLPHWLSDAFCRLSTGGGFATRTLYMDDEETVFSEVRPIILNGIEDLAGRPDLADRSVIIFLPRIPAEKRRTEKEFWAGFNERRGFIQGALFDLIAKALAMLPSVKIEEPPRMADFAVWGEAVGRSLGFKAGEFLEAYEHNRGLSSHSAVESSLVAMAIRKFAERQNTDWVGTATDLLKLLNEIVDEKTTKERNWPKLANGLSNAINRLAPSLRGEGLVIETGGRDKNKKLIRIGMLPEFGPEPSNTSNTGPNSRRKSNGCNTLSDVRSSEQPSDMIEQPSNASNRKSLPRFSGSSDNRAEGSNSSNMDRGTGFRRNSLEKDSFGENGREAMSDGSICSMISGGSSGDDVAGDIDVLDAEEVA